MHLLVYRVACPGWIASTFSEPVEPVNRPWYTTEGRMKKNGAIGRRVQLVILDSKIECVLVPTTFWRVDYHILIARFSIERLREFTY